MKVLVISRSLYGVGICTILERQAGWQIQHESTQSHEALYAAIERYQPQVTILDCMSLNVLELFGQLELPRVRLLGRIVAVVAGRALDEETFFLLVKWGVSACIKASTTSEDLVATLRRVGNDEWLLTCDILLEEAKLPETLRCTKKETATPPLLAHFPFAQKPEDLEPDSPLSAREEQILFCIAQGRSNKQVACELGLNEHTLTHSTMPAIFARLSVSNRTAAVAYALRKRWMRMPAERPALVCTAAVA
jgi:DNA-binding NarL/FixJ family response regulator